VPCSSRACLLIAALGAGLSAAGAKADEQAAVSPAALGQQPVQQAEVAAPAALQPEATPAPVPAGTAATRNPGKLIAATPAQQPPAELAISADSQGLDLLANRFVAVGHVQITLAGGRLLADRLEYDTSTRTLYISGQVRFQRGNHYLQASRLRYSLIENSGELEEVYGVLDLDSSAFDLNPERTPSAALLPLSYWEHLAAPFDQPPQLRVDRRIEAPLVPLTNPSSTSNSQPSVLFQGIAQRPLGRPESLSAQQWRMPPVALSPAAQTMACPPPLPAIPDWHPYPWATTLWGGQMIDTNFGDTFKFKGRLRPEYLAGIGLNKRLVKAGPLALEFDSNAMLHHANAQAGGAFNQSTPFAETPSQTFGEFTGGLGLRVWLQPWLSVGFVEGVSLNTTASNYEKTFRQKYTNFLNYLGFEVETLVSPQWSLVGRIHHRSGAYGTYSGVKEGSNAYLLGLRYRFGQSSAPSLKLAMAPADGCPDPGQQRKQRRKGLGEQLNTVASGPSQQAIRSASPTPQPGASRLSPAAQEAQRDQALAAVVDQRIQDLQYQGSLTAERRRAAANVTYQTPDEVNAYGEVKPVQLQIKTTQSNQQLVQGTVTRWRLQANTLQISPQGLQADRAALTNDPYTPAQSWVDAVGVTAKLKANGDLVIQAASNQLILEDRLPIPLQRNQTYEKKRDVNNRWVLAVDSKDRDGAYIGYNAETIHFGRNQEGQLRLQPQFMVRRALDGSTDSYVLPGQSAGAAPSSQPTRIGDLFGLLATVQTPLLGMTAKATLDASTFDPSNFANGTRSWGDLSQSFKLPIVGDVQARLFAAYRYRVWNGSVGEQDIYSAVGGLLEKQAQLPKWGQLSSNYLLRIGAGNFQGNDFNTNNLGDFWRASLYGTLNASYPLWTGKALPAGPQGANRFSAVPIVPGLTLNANTSLNLATYGNGTKQYAVSLSGGPTLTLGHFSRNAFDWTQFTVTGGGTLRQGESPFSFDRIVDLGTINVGLTQQLIGPLVFSGGIGLNVDPNSPYFGDTTNSYVELRWQRRAYELAVYYSPYEQIAGIRVKLNDFNFTGTGLPFVPYNPTTLDGNTRRPTF
jgi:Protein of unknown function (DUF3769)